MKYTFDHTWVSVQGQISTFGITNYLAAELDDIVLVNWNRSTGEVQAGESCASIENTTKAVDLLFPVTGDIVEINKELEANPELITDDAEGNGWFMKIKLKDLSQVDDMMDSDAYQKFVASEGDE